MRRRELMLLLGGWIMVAPTALAQQKATPVVGTSISPRLRRGLLIWAGTWSMRD